MWTEFRWTMLFERINCVQMYWGWTGCGREKYRLKLSGHNDMYIYVHKIGQN